MGSIPREISNRNIVSDAPDFDLEWRFLRTSFHADVRLGMALPIYRFPLRSANRNGVSNSANSAPAYDLEWSAPYSDFCTGFRFGMAFPIDLILR